MAHVLDGTWKSFVMQNGTPKDDGVFEIEVDTANNKLEPKSKHDGKEIKGEVGEGKFRHIFVRKEIAPKRNYVGFLMVNGPTMIMVGVLNLNPSRLMELQQKDTFSEKDLIALVGQEQEIWVATKP